MTMLWIILCLLINKVTQADIYAKVGETVKLSCNTTCAGPVDWRYQREATIDEEYVCIAAEESGTTNCVDYKQWPRVNVNISTPSDFTLIIHNATVGDSGLYHCVYMCSVETSHTNQLTISVPECASNPCQNNGTCTEGDNWYTCACPVNYNGTNCDLDVDECVSEPCQNGGHCINGDNEYTCDCLPSFDGINCETAVKSEEANIVYIYVFTTLGVVVVVVVVVIAAVLVFSRRQKRRRIKLDDLQHELQTLVEAIEPSVRNQPSRGVKRGEKNDELTCPVCFNVFLMESALGDRRPNFICLKMHTVCADCYKYLKEHKCRCPTCDDTLLLEPIINQTLMKFIDDFLSSVPKISVDDVTLRVVFARGAFADVYDAAWRHQDVAVKVFQSMSDIDKQTKQLQIEVNLVIGLFHPNIVRLFGTTKLSGDQFGIVMEKIDSGSLDQHIMSLERQSATSIAIGVIDGLNYVHSRKIAHRDLKPQNILLSGLQLIPKIADFGVSNVIRAVINNLAMEGTPKYTAPELLSSGSTYGWPADIFSLSVIIFEMFSGLPAETGLDKNAMKIKFAWVEGVRPKIPAEFPVELSPMVEQGWAQNPMERTSLDLFRNALQLLDDRGFTRRKSTVSPSEPENKQVSRKQQSNEVAKVSLRLPMLSLKWDSSCELLNSEELRVQMIDDIQNMSNMAEIVNESVLSVMEVVPRHLFVEEKRMTEFVAKKRGKLDKQDIVNFAYRYNRAIPATMNSNESAPEIIGTQLSMTEILQGQSVLLVGIKGGYIQSLVAQLVGINGCVVTVTSDVTALKVCQDRVDANCPFKSIVKWITVADVNNVASIVEVLKNSKRPFNTIIYCGSVNQFPLQLRAVLHPLENVSMMAPVSRPTGDYGQRFLLYVRRSGSDAELRTITDFGVIFEEVK